LQAGVAQWSSISGETFQKCIRRRWWRAQQPDQRRRRKGCCPAGAWIALLRHGVCASLIGRQGNILLKAGPAREQLRLSGVAPGLDDHCPRPMRAITSAGWVARRGHPWPCCQLHLIVMSPDTVPCSSYETFLARLKNQVAHVTYASDDFLIRYANVDGAAVDACR
jgi:hypothetical protein